MNARGPFRFLAVALGALLCLSGIVASPAEAATSPRLSVIAADDEVELIRYGTEPVWLDLGLFVAAEDAPFQVTVHRPAYDEPAQVRQVFGDGRTRRLSSSLIGELGAGFERFFKVVVKNKKGKTVHKGYAGFCPNGWEQVRLSPDASDASRFPYDCGFSPLALGSVWGIDPGWAASAPLGSADLKDGKYSITVSMTERYRETFRTGTSKAKLSAVVKTMEWEDECCVTRPGPRSSNDDDEQPGEQPSQPPNVPGSSARPDLVAGPAWAITPRSEEGRDYLDFAATVWNAGPANLVVDGFRKRGEKRMQAYQSFYENGTKVGTVKTGSLVYDPRPGHEHWHFLDFAAYRLLDASKDHVVTSGKEAFCLAPTDAIDLSVAGAVWRPESIGFGTACGGRSALSIREVLPSGWGDTYFQSIPGQSFDITGIPNGTYYIQVVANPEDRLHEVSGTNNVSLRKIVLGGVSGDRTVKVSAYQGLTI